MRIFLTLLLLIITQGVCSQDWVKVYSDQKIEVYKSTHDHEIPSRNQKHERIIFKYVNLTNQEISFNISREHYYEGKCSGCDGNENVYQITLKSKETKKYNPEFIHNKTYYVFKKDYKGFIKRQLTDLKIKHVKYL